MRKGLWTWWHRGQRFFSAVAAHDLGAYAAALAYNFLFALPPLALFLAALLGFWHLPADPQQWLKGPWQVLLPPPLTRFLDRWGETLIAHRHPALLSLGGLGFVWGTSGAFRQLIDALNHIEGISPARRSLVATYALSLAAGALFGLLLAAAVALAWWEEVALAPTHPRWIWILGWRWVLLLTTIWGLLTLAYRYLPDTPQPVHAWSRGTVVAVAGWLAGTWGLSRYAQWSRGLSAVYGGLTTLVLLMLYFYLTALVILFGAEVNRWYRERSKPNPGQLQEHGEAHPDDPAHDGAVDPDPL